MGEDQRKMSTQTWEPDENNKIFKFPTAARVT